MSTTDTLVYSAATTQGHSLDTIGRYRYIALVKCPYIVADKASPRRQSLSARRGKRYTDIGLFSAHGGITF